MNAEWEIGVSLITGLMFGLEFPNTDDVGEDVAFSVVLDLGILRIVVIRWNLEKE